MNQVVTEKDCTACPLRGTPECDRHVLGIRCEICGEVMNDPNELLQHFIKYHPQIVIEYEHETGQKVPRVAN